MCARGFKFLSGRGRGIVKDFPFNVTTAFSGMWTRVELKEHCVRGVEDFEG